MLNSVWVQTDGTQAGVGAVSNQESDPHHGGDERDNAQVQGEHPDENVNHIDANVFAFDSLVLVSMVELMLR